MRDAQHEHLDDPNDFAGARYLMDDGEVSLVTCEVCRRNICTCDDFGLEPDRLRSRRPAPVTDR